jgi:hypothetical protein
MAQIQDNPWNFTNADQASSFAITSIARNGEASALVTSAAHGFTGNEQISIQGTTVKGWTGGYRVLAVPSATTFLIAIPGYKHTLANNGANGNVLTAAYLDIIRAEQILWDKTSAGQELLLTDVNGVPIWNPHTTVADAPYTYGKVFFIRGLVINTLPASSNVQITIN